MGCSSLPRLDQYGWDQTLQESQETPESDPSSEPDFWMLEREASTASELSHVPTEASTPDASESKPTKFTSNLPSQPSEPPQPSEPSEPSEQIAPDVLDIYDMSGALPVDWSVDSASQQIRPSIASRLVSDQSNFYSRELLLGLGVVVGAGAAIANTSADEQLQKHFQSSVRGASSDDWFEFLHANKELGNGVYTLPIMGAAWLASEAIDGPPALEAAGNWGERSLRGFLVGAPPLILLQRATGGSRPHENNESSEWHFLADNNGVSGHAFMSSLPFITAAKLTNSPIAKGFFYAGSLIGPLSRVNDNAHYPSQIGMGWALAYLAATAVQETDTGQRGWRLIPRSPTDGSGIALQYRW